MTAPILQLGKRVRPALPADLTASLRTAGVESFVDSAGQTWEWSSFKTRYVRTAAGARRYGLPIGSPIVGKGRQPAGPAGSAPRPAAPAPAQGGSSPGAGGQQVKPTPAQKAAAERHLGPDRGARVDGNRVVVEDRDKAVAALDEALAGDMTPGERKATKNLRAKIAASEPGPANSPVEDTSTEDAQVTPEPTPSPETPTVDEPDQPDEGEAALRPATPDGVRDAYWDLASERAEPVRLSELRKRMGGTRAEQDQALNDMALDDDVLIREEANQQLLTDEDRDAAVRLGGLDRHNIQIDADPPGSDSSAPVDDPAPARRVSAAEVADDFRSRMELSKQERGALSDWTGTSASLINGDVRAGRSNPDADRINDMINRYELPGDATAYRALGAGVIPDGDQTGQVITAPGFSATALDRPAGGEFRDLAQYPVRMELSLPRGTRGVALEGTEFAFPDQREFILPPNSRFVIESDTTGPDGVRQIRATVLPPLEGP